MVAEMVVPSDVVVTNLEGDVVPIGERVDGKMGNTTGLVVVIDD